MVDNLHKISKTNDLDLFTGILRIPFMRRNTKSKTNYTMDNLNIDSDYTYNYKYDENLDNMPN